MHACEEESEGGETSGCGWQMWVADVGGRGQKDQINFYKDIGSVERDLWMRAAEARCWSASWLRRLPTCSVNSLTYDTCTTH